MTDEEIERQRAEFNAKLVQLLDGYAEALGRSVDSPVVSDWALVVAIDSLGDAQQGSVHVATPTCQWRHRTRGLLGEAVHLLDSVTVE